MARSGLTLLVMIIQMVLYKDMTLAKMNDDLKTKLRK